jgi:hypothetical protein
VGQDLLADLAHGADGPGRIQVIISPPGFEAFFEELDVLARQGSPDMGAVVALAGKYGVEFLGPPPA